MPKIFKDIILYNEFPELKSVINPLATNLLWLRGMDTKPMLMTNDQINNELIYL
jgi:carbamoyl-phosphate synthase large subunit